MGFPMHVPSSLLSSFVTLFVTIGPIETAVIFASLTSGIHHKERRSIPVRSVAIAGLMLLLFAVAGNLVLSLLHVSLPAFRDVSEISGRKAKSVARNKTWTQVFRYVALLGI